MQYIIVYFQSEQQSEDYKNKNTILSEKLEQVEDKLEITENILKTKDAEFEEVKK